MLTLETVHKSHLEQLNAFDADVTAEFCKLALQTLLVHGDLAKNEKLYAKAASRLNVSLAKSIRNLRFLYKIYALLNPKVSWL